MFFRGAQPHAGHKRQPKHLWVSQRQAHTVPGPVSPPTTHAPAKQPAGTRPLPAGANLETEKQTAEKLKNNKSHTDSIKYSKQTSYGAAEQAPGAVVPCNGMVLRFVNAGVTPALSNLGFMLLYWAGFCYQQVSMHAHMSGTLLHKLSGGLHLLKTLVIPGPKSNPKQKHKRQGRVAAPTAGTPILYTYGGTAVCCSLV